VNRAPFAAAASVAFVMALAPPADAGPVKHWGTFPGREVRAVAVISPAGVPS
jgi:hypothetical protein